MDWPIDLSSPPKVAAIATNIHGFKSSETFLLPELWSLHLYRYSGQLVVNGQSLPIRPGHAAIVPPGVANEYRYEGVSPHLYVHFSLPRTDGPVNQIPAMQDLGDRFQAIYQRMAEVVDSPNQVQIEARVWDLLWELASPRKLTTVNPQIHASVELVTRLIEERLSRPLTVEQLAKEADLTPSYLSVLFRQVHGEPVLAYIRGKRMKRAIHLLRSSTMPIKSIANSVGYPDLQHFNKAIRAATGMSPKSLRLGSA